MNIKTSITEFFRNLIPTKQVTRFDRRTMLPALAHTVTVDSVHEMFRAAEGGFPERLFALYRDIVLSHSHLQGQFATRKRAVLGDTLNIQPFDKKNPDDIAAKNALWPITNHPDFFGLLNHLLDGHLWPVSVAEKIYVPSTRPGLRYEIGRLVPVPHDLLDFHTGELRIKDVDDQGRTQSTTHEADPRRYIIHRGHLLSSPDQWGGPMRSLVIWWLLGTQGREWWARFLERYGAPFTVAKYQSGDDDSRIILTAALQAATRLHGLVITDGTEVEIKQAMASDSGDAFAAFHDVANREISKLIVGQTLSADAAPTGLGSGVANAQSQVRDDIRQLDAKVLGATLSTQLAKQFLQINGLRGQPPIFTWGSVSSAEIQSLAQFLTSLSGAGMRVADEGIETVSERAGLPLERVQATAPTNPFLPFSVQSHAAIVPLEVEDAIARVAAATLPRSLGRHLAPMRQIILDSKSPTDALAKVEAYAAKFEPGEAARLIEEALIAFAANGAVAQIS